MNTTIHKIPNKHNELLNIEVVRNTEKPEIILLVHGSSVDMHQLGMYDQFIEVFKDEYTIVRFDFTGHGESEGSSDFKTYKDYADDLERVLQFVRKEVGKEINIFANSRGTSIVNVLQPIGIKNTVLAGITNTDPEFVLKRTNERIESKGTQVDLEGITTRVRSNGKVERIDKSFWEDIRNYKSVELNTELSNKTRLLLIHSKQDEVVLNDYLDDYKLIDTLDYLELDGSHNFDNSENRQKLFDNIREFLNNDEELLPIVNEEDNLIGSAYRSIAHRNPDLIHQEAVAYIFSTDMTQILLQQRALNKRNTPGAWRPITGHVEFGEDPIQSAAREMYEEQFLKLDLKFVFKELHRSEEHKESKFYHVFFATTPTDIELKWDKAESNDVKWFDLKDTLEGRTIDLGETVPRHLNRLLAEYDRSKS